MQYDQNIIKYTAKILQRSFTNLYNVFMSRFSLVTSVITFYSCVCLNNNTYSVTGFIDLNGFKTIPYSFPPPKLPIT